MSQKHTTIHTVNLQHEYTLLLIGVLISVWVLGFVQSYSATEVLVQMNVNCVAAKCYPPPPPPEPSASGGGGTGSKGGGFFSNEHSNLIDAIAQLREGDLHEAALASDLFYFIDVPDDAWYAGAINAFLRQGVLDTKTPYFRPGDDSLRAEVAALVVKMADSDRPFIPMQTSSFDDVPIHSPYAPYVHEAARQGWIKGHNNCYETGQKPCYFKPELTISRAEAAAITVRFFNLPQRQIAPNFSDNSPDEWYTTYISTAADHCVLQGDKTTHLVRPKELINRAELVTMKYRASQKLRYGAHCQFFANIAPPNEEDRYAPEVPAVKEASHTPEKQEHKEQPSDETKNEMPSWIGSNETPPDIVHPAAQTFDAKKKVFIEYMKSEVEWRKLQRMERSHRMCFKNSFTCIGEAALRDTYNLASSLLYRGGRFTGIVQTVPISESIIWILSLMWIFLGARFLIKGTSFGHMHALNMHKKRYK